MNSAEHLLPEDRAEFERTLDEALRAARRRAGGDRFRLEQLRAMAVNAMPLIVPAAADEYERFVQLRRESRTWRPRPEGAAQGGGQAGPGVMAVVSVLVPVLAGIAAAVFLPFGYLLGLSDPEPPLAASLRTAGWVFAVVALCGMLVAAIELLVAAVRNGATSVTAAADPVADEVSLARREWRRALLERGIDPFLRDALAAADTPGARGAAGVWEPRRRESRTPRLRFTSPDFTSPAAGRAEGRGEPASGARFLHPDFTSPKFTSPADGGADRD